MNELPEKKLKEICNNYINGNRSSVREAIKKMNKLQIANFIMRSSNYGVPRHSAYVQVQFTFENEI